MADLRTSKMNSSFLLTTHSFDSGLIDAGSIEGGMTLKISSSSALKNNWIIINVPKTND